MASKGWGWLRAVWNGPFYIGPLSRPVSVGDVLIKLLETAWRIAISCIATAVLALSVALAWSSFIEPVFFPPLSSQIETTVTYDDGTTPIPPSIGTKPFRCTKDYPLKIRFFNKSNKIISQINFSIVGHPVNNSMNVVKFGYDRNYYQIIPAGYFVESCWAVAVEDDYIPSNLDYSVDIWSASEADPKTKFKPTPMMPNPSSPSPTSTQPAASASPTSPPNRSPTTTLADIRDADWKQIGMGCACSFSTGLPHKEKLIAGGDGKAFFRPNGRERLCTAPDVQTLFDGSVSLACGSAAVQITPFGKVEPGMDGHSSKARLTLSETSGTTTLSGTWGCSC